MPSSKCACVQVIECDDRRGRGYTLNQRIVLGGCFCLSGFSAKLQEASIEKYVDGMVQAAMVHH